jgi:hypothetical protein
LAVEFGVLSFEDVFLSHFEWIMKDGSRTTIGAMFKPQLLSAPKQETKDVDIIGADEE